MTDVKISELTELDATPAVGDFLAIVDTDATATKKITPVNLLASALPLAGGTLTGAVLAGADGSGVDVTLNTDTAGDLVLWDASDKALEFTDSTIAMQDNAITRPEFTDYAETVNAIGDTGGGSDAIDISLGNVVTATVSTGEQTFTFTSPSASGKSCSFTLILTNGGSQTVNWPAAVDWAGGAAPSLTASGVDVLTFLTVDGGTIWYGFAGGLDMK